MKCTISIDLDNAAFGTSPRYELARILSDLALDLQSAHHVRTNIRDINGNTVGSFKITE